jgi:hypothetical protein
MTTETVVTVTVETLQDDVIQVGDDEWERPGTQSWQATAGWGTNEAGAIERAQSLGNLPLRVVRITTTREILWETPR